MYVTLNSFYFSGTAQSIGCTIDKMAPHTVIDKIDAGEIEVPEE